MESGEDKENIVSRKRVVVPGAEDIRASEWNEKHPVGQKVQGYSFYCGPDHNESFSSHTTSEAWDCNDADTLVQVDGKRGGCCVRFLVVQQMRTNVAQGEDKT